MDIQQATDRECVDCGKAEGWTVRATTIRQRFGRVTVSDAGVMVPHCNACGAWFISSVALGEVEVRAAVAALRDTGGTLDGAGMLMVRKVFGFSQTHFATLVGYETKETISRWETGALPCPRAAQLAALAYLEALAQHAVSVEMLEHMLSKGQVPVISHSGIDVSESAAA